MTSPIANSCVVVSPQRPELAVPCATGRKAMFMVLDTPATWTVPESGVEAKPDSGSTWNTYVPLGSWKFSELWLVVRTEPFSWTDQSAPAESPVSVNSKENCPDGHAPP